MSIHVVTICSYCIWAKFKIGAYEPREEGEVEERNELPFISLQLHCGICPHITDFTGRHDRRGEVLSLCHPLEHLFKWWHAIFCLLLTRHCMVPGDDKQTEIGHIPQPPRIEKAGHDASGKHPHVSFIDVIGMPDSSSRIMRSWILVWSGNIGQLPGDRILVC